MTVRPPLTNPLTMVRQMQDACCKCVKPLSYLKGKSAHGHVYATIKSFPKDARLKACFVAISV